MEWNINYPPYNPSILIKPHILMPKYVFQLNLNVNSEKPETNYASLPIPIPAYFGRIARLLLVYLISPVLMSNDKRITILISKHMFWGSGNLIKLLLRRYLLSIALNPQC